MAVVASAAVQAAGASVSHGACPDSYSAVFRNASLLLHCVFMFLCL